MIVIALTAVAFLVARPWESHERAATNKESPTANSGDAKTAPPALSAPPVKAGDSLLTVSGYIINRERIELSPRMMNEVKWIGVKKGDRVKKGEVVVRLDDAEQQARVAELDAQIAVARVAIERASLSFDRIKRLRATKNESAEREDEARLALASAEAQVRQLEAARATAMVWLEWTVIRSPIDGVVLEKLADPGELVTPQTFGGTRGPSSALLSLADPNDLQVEVDISEADLPKVSLNQRCRVSPEAWPEKVYAGRVSEIAPEANRQKGTLQIKVQIEQPDRFLTPELSAKVEFLKSGS
jgi:RND family efflux transporter MFP subunit